jgi:hypothetical protein
MDMKFFRLSKEKIIVTIVCAVLYTVAFYSSGNVYTVCDSWFGGECHSPSVFEKSLAKFTLPLYLLNEIAMDVLGLDGFALLILIFIESLLMWYLITCIVFHFTSMYRRT